MERETTIKELIQRREDRDKAAVALSKLPWHEIIQQDGQEHRLRRVEAMQRDTFGHILRKRHRHLMAEEKSMFAMFMTEFLEGECGSLAEFLYKEPHKVVKGEFVRNLKDIWKAN